MLLERKGETTWIRSAKKEKKHESRGRKTAEKTALTWNNRAAKERSRLEEQKTKKKKEERKYRRGAAHSERCTPKLSDASL